MKMNSSDSYTSTVKLNLDPKGKKRRRRASSILSRKFEPASPVDAFYYRASSVTILERYGRGSPVDSKYYVDRRLEEPRTSSEIFVPRSPSESEEEEKEKREIWTGRLDFLLSCVGYAVGLGNIWRFPYLCYSSGGGAFFIPYVLFLVVCALPLFLMETSFGQFTSLSPLTVWKLCPLFKGIGYGMVIITGIVCIYYNIIITWTFYFVFATMQSTLPWGRCDEPWNTENCIGPGSSRNESELQNGNKTITKGTPASVEYWERNVLRISKGIEDFGGIRQELLGCLALAWITVFLCLFKGVKSSGKVVYVTATFPYLVLTIMLCSCATLPGAFAGIKWYLVPNWEKLGTFKVWGDAAVQIFFSVGMAWGSLITLSSYNKFSNNVFRDAMVVPMINCGTSVFAGLVIFSILGFMSDSLGVPIEKVVTQGPGLIFIVYPEAVTKMSASHFWAILFFLMILSIGMDSQFGMFETMTSAFVDEYPRLLRNNKVLFTAFMCLVEFCLGVPMVFEGGFYLLTLSDWYCSSFSLMLLSLIECLVIAWLYGVDRFRKDIELMTGNKPSIMWKLLWKYITPTIVFFTWGFSLYQIKPVTVGDYDYPKWAIILGWCFALCSILPVPIYVVYAVYTDHVGTVKQRILKLIQPAAGFGPSQYEDRLRYLGSFDDFDWLRYNAILKNMDWRTYKKYLHETNRSSSNMAPALVDSTALEEKQVQVILNKLSQYQKTLLESVFFEEEIGDVREVKRNEGRDWHRQVLNSSESGYQGDIGQGQKEMNMLRDKPESFPRPHRGKHVRCHSI